MCSLFGFVNYSNRVSNKILQDIYKYLAKESEVRGKHATGVAYIHKEKVQVVKKAVEGSQFKFKIPQDLNVLMGHTRHTTQGSEKDNFNNHPFKGKVEGNKFALAHNGMIWNDKILRQDLNMPKTHIETDSYIAVQLLELLGTVTKDSVAKMCESLKGVYTFTVLDQNNTLFIAKGENPISVIDFKDLGLLVYASTNDILWRAIGNTTLGPAMMNQELGEHVVIKVNNGEVIEIDDKGGVSHHNFTVTKSYDVQECHLLVDEENQMLEYLYDDASLLGIDIDEAQYWLDQGYSLEDIIGFDPFTDEI